MDLVYILHFYQPPFMERVFLEKVYRDSYLKIFQALKKNKRARVIANITGSTLQKYHDAGIYDLAEGFKELYNNGQIIFTSGSFSHALLPFTSDEQFRRQVDLQESTLINLLDIPDYTFDIFYPPELMINESVVDKINNRGIKHLICSGNSIPEYNPDTKIYEYKNTILLPRSTLISRIIEHDAVDSGKKFFDEINRLNINKDDLYIVAHDAEFIGHHFEGTKTKLFEDLLSSRDINFVFPEDLKNVKTKEVKNVYYASWEKTKIKGKEFDPHWANPKNKVHYYQWKLSNLVVNQIEQLQTKDLKCRGGYQDFQNALDYIQYSCQYWWASSFPFWHPSIIRDAAWNWYRLAHQVVNQYPDKTDKKFLSIAGRYYFNLLKYLAKYDTSGWSRKNIEYYDKKLHNLKRTYKI